MKGTLKNNFLELNCNLDNHFLFTSGPGTSGANFCTNVCGITQIGKTTYCAKNNTSCKTAVYAYTSANQANWITNIPLDYYCIDMTTNGTDLFLLGRTSTSFNGESVIIQMSTDGTTKKIYTVDFDASGLTFYKKDAGHDLFMVLRNSPDNTNLTVEVGYLDTSVLCFLYKPADSLHLTNTGYKLRVQGIHYAGGPLLVITNNDYATCENAIMVYSNFYCPKPVYNPIAKFYVKPASTSYTQFTLKGACADENGKLTVIVNGDGPSAAYFDAVKKIPINFTDGRFEVELSLIRGSNVPSTEKFSNLGTMALDGTTLYAIKTKTDENKNEMQRLLKTTNYTDVKTLPSLIKTFTNATDENDAILGHANGMELCNGHLFVCGPKSIERLTLDGTYSKRYTTTFAPKGIAWDDSNVSQGLFYVLGSTRNNGSDGYKYYPLHLGRLTGSEYTNESVIGYVRIGLKDSDLDSFNEGTQDIINRDGFGLFIVYNKGFKNAAEKYDITKSALLHVDVDSITDWDGVPRVIPDYALTVTAKAGTTNEIESGAFDTANNRLVLCSNYLPESDCIWYTDSNWVFKKS